MQRTWDRVLDRLWLALSGAAALALALQGGAQLGQRGWSNGGALQAAQAATPDASVDADRQGTGCRAGGTGLVPVDPAGGRNRAPPRP